MINQIERLKTMFSSAYHQAMMKPREFVIITTVDKQGRLVSNRIKLDKWNPR